MNIKIEIHDNNVNSTKRNISKWSIPDSLKKDLNLFLNDLGIGKVNKGVRVSEATQKKYLFVLRTSLEYFNKELDKLNIKDIESFEKALNSDKLKSWKKKPFSSATKSNMRICLKILLKWKLGHEKAEALTGWIDTNRQKKTPDYLKESEIHKLYKSCKSAKERFLIAVLFDSGSRAEEFHNIRMEDIEIPENNNNYVKLTLKEEYSKTEGRVISLFWYKSIEAVKDYILERKQQGIKLNEAVYEDTYDAARMFLGRLGNKVLGKSIHFHLFRHSSATYYAPKMNRQELCYRYGWKFSSPMPDVYISRAGMQGKELDEKFSATEINQLKNDLEKQKQDFSLKLEALTKVLDSKLSFTSLVEAIDKIQVIKKKPSTQ